MSANTNTPLTFDDTALRRLEALVAKKKDAKLSADENLDLREMRNRRAMARQAAEAAANAEKRRRHEDRDKYRLGGLALAVGLKDWPDDLLTAGFAYLAGLSDREKAALLQRHANSNAAAGSGSGTPAARAEG